MKILALLGSPRKKGNTANLLNKYLEGVKEVYPEATVKSIFLQEENLKPCKGCYGCQMGKIEYCVTKDNTTEIYKEFLNADIIIFATPIYSFSMSAQMKIFVDRMFAISNKIAGKKVVSLAVYGDIKAESSGVLNHRNVMNALCEYTGMKLIESYDTSTAITMVSENEEVLRDIYELGKKLK